MFKIKNLIIILNIIIIISIVEIFFLYALNYKTIVKTNTCSRIYDKEHDYSYYSPNCIYEIKHWEQKDFVTYKINSEGRREINKEYNLDSRKIAFIGDSFTFGAMVPIEDNYNFYSFNNILNSPYEIHNFGTPAEQLHNVFNKLKTLNINEYEYFVYGLTPNDFFDYVDGSYNVTRNKIKNISSDPNNRKKLLFNKIKNFLTSSGSFRFILHNIMSNDNLYSQLYLSRTPYSGYLLADLPEEWSKSIRYFDKLINDLPHSYKSKLKIFIIPQRAEVVLNRLEKYNQSFVKEIIKICKKNNIDCSYPDLNGLSKIKETHFPVDGHLNIDGNHVLAKYLSKWAATWN